jgi:membrane-bound lytic murein transglycosylase A
VIVRRLSAVAALVAALAACAAPPAPPPKPPADKLVLIRAGFAELPGWTEDDPSAALPALLKSCAILLKGPDGQALGVAGLVADWRGPCADAAQVPPNDKAAARAVFERDFVPFRTANNDKTEGLFTGYYEAELHGAMTRDDRYHVPLYRRPADLVSVDLGQFRPSLKGERIAGRVAGGKLVPYPTRTEIEAGALAGKGLELAWVDNATDAFFLAVQGSGRVILPDGQIMRIGYDGENGQPYVAIGRVLAAEGIPADQITMPFLRQWIAEHGTDGTALMDKNPSYIFFRELKGDGPMGAEGVALTPGRSAAVDRGFVPLGLPFWVDTTDPVEPSGRLRRLFVAQDVGGAIRGPVRADLFFGYGADAANHAGLMKGRGSSWLLLPAAAAARQAPGT